MMEHATPRGVRARALGRCLAHVVAEQRASQYQGLSPVNGLLNCLALFAGDPRHPDLAPSLAGLEAWRWDDEAGVRFAGARSNTWDTAFALEALAAGAASPATADAVRRGYAFLVGAQMTAELPSGEAVDRDPVLGGWCFSDGVHRWPVSDCAAEAVSALLAVEARPALAPPAGERIPRDRLRQAVDFILSRQNADGGFATYERRRAPVWLERLNPSEMFGRCMTERSYVECTASALVALGRVRDAVPSLAGDAVNGAIAAGVAFLRNAQRADGSVPGFWGINFTYGAFHFVRGLLAAGVRPDDAALRQAAAWLVAHQRADGGWGEHWSGCLTDTYVEHAEGQAVMTSWALLALLPLLGRDAEPVRRGIAWLVARQDADGVFPAGTVNGVFFGTAMLDYRLYRVYFPAWALAHAHAVTR
jgi:lanosterol synthase